MRILIIHNQLWAHYKSKLFSEIHSYLLKNDPNSKLSVVHIAEYEQSRSHMVDDLATSFYQYPSKVLFKGSLDSVSFLSRLKALYNEIQSFKPSVINFTGYYDWAQIALMLLCKLKGIRIVLSTESSTADNHRSTWKETIKRNILSLPDAFFCFGTSSAAYLKTLAIPENKIVVRNAAVIDDELIKKEYDAHSKPDVNTSAFIYVGRLSEEKNIARLISAFINCKSQGKENNWKLKIVGDGPTAKSLKTLASACNHVIFEGSFPWYQIPAQLAQSDVLILPSKSEPWGLVVNEAMACGMPVIVSDKCGCAPDLVHNKENGFIFDPENQAELETALYFFMENPEKISAMGAKSLELVKKFSARTVAREMVACYKSL